MAHLAVTTLGHRNAGKSSTWNTLFRSTVRTGKYERRLYLNKAQFVPVFLVSGSPEERDEYVGDLREQWRSPASFFARRNTSSRCDRPTTSSSPVATTSTSNGSTLGTAIRTYTRIIWHCCPICFAKGRPFKCAAVRKTRDRVARTSYAPSSAGLHTTGSFGLSLEADVAGQEEKSLGMTASGCGRSRLFTRMHGIDRLAVN